MERKFQPTDELIRRLDGLRVSLEVQQFTDRYFDTASFDLSTRDRWLRTRNGQAELKSPLEGEASAGVDVYRETRSMPEIVRLLNQVLQVKLPSTLGGSDEFATHGLHPFAEIDTSRRRYLIRTPSSRAVHVDIDQCYFRHPNLQGSQTSYFIGEVELIEGMSSASAAEELRRVFEYLEISPMVVRGKVLEFLFRARGAHYSALERAGLIDAKLPPPMNPSPIPHPNPSPAKSILQKAAVNIHFTRKCNFGCKFCFHTAKTSYVLPPDSLIAIIRLLAEAGVEKINFAGGEPTLPSYRRVLGEMTKAAKKLGISSVSIISNGSQMKSFSLWLEEYGEYLDILGISCDTLHAETNLAHGRHNRGSKAQVANLDDPLANLRLAKDLCNRYGVHFKINTVVTALNKDEDMSGLINELRPMRWKIFQVLPLEGENLGVEGRDISRLLVTREEFDGFVELNRRGLEDPSVIRPENNDEMRGSYLLIDEFGRFLDCTTGGKIPTRSILDVGLEAAVEELVRSSGGGFEKDTFLARGGYYPESWSRSYDRSACSA